MTEDFSKSPLELDQPVKLAYLNGLVFYIGLISHGSLNEILQGSPMRGRHCKMQAEELLQYFFNSSHEIQSNLVDLIRAAEVDTNSNDFYSEEEADESDTSDHEDLGGKIPFPAPHVSDFEENSNVSVHQDTLAITSSGHPVHPDDLQSADEDTQEAAEDQEEGKELDREMNCEIETQSTMSSSEVESVDIFYEVETAGAVRVTDDTNGLSAVQTGAQIESQARPTPMNRPRSSSKIDASSKVLFDDGILRPPMNSAEEMKEYNEATNAEQFRPISSAKSQGSRKSISITEDVGRKESISEHQQQENGEAETSKRNVNTVISPAVANGTNHEVQENRRGKASSLVNQTWHVPSAIANDHAVAHKAYAESVEPFLRDLRSFVRTSSDSNVSNAAVINDAGLGSAKADSNPDTEEDNWTDISKEISQGSYGQGDGIIYVREGVINAALLDHYGISWTRLAEVEFLITNCSLF